MSRTDLTEEALVKRLARAFDAEVADVRVAAEPFEPVLRGGDLPPVRRSAWRRPLVAAAAAVAVVVLAAGAVIVRSQGEGSDAPADSPRPDVETGEPSRGIAPPDGVPAPTVVPDDLTLWGVDWFDGGGGVMFTQQLFQRADGAGLVVVVQPGGDGSTGGEPVTVRELPGTTMPAKEFADTDTSLFWSEGASLTATYSGLTQAEAVALLDSLTWRSDDRTQGFAPPPAGSGFDLRVDAIADADGTGAPVLAGRFRYVDDPASVMPGQGRQVEVRTTTGPSGLSTASSSLQPLLHGDPREDGGIEAYDPDFGSLTVRLPDGRSVWVDANGTPVSRDELRAIADGVSPVHGDELAALEAEVSASVVAATPLVTEADLPSATVTVRGAPTGEIVCIVVDRESCPSLAGSSGVVTSSLLIDGAWWVAAVGPGALSVHEMPSAPDVPGTSAEVAEAIAVHDGESGPVVPGESGSTLDGRAVVLVRPDPSLTSLLVQSSVGEGMEVRRPGT